MSNLSLYHMTKEYESAFLELVDADIPLEALDDTLQALEGELMLKGANVAAFVLNLEAEIDKIKAVEQRLAGRRKVFENKMERFRTYLRENMERAGIKKIEALDGSFSATLTKARASVVIDDEKLIPKKYLKIEKSPKKAEISQALQAKEEVPGAHLKYQAGLKIG